MKKIYSLIIILLFSANVFAGPYYPDSGGSGNIATDTIWDVAGDTVYGTGSNTSARLAAGTAYQLYMMNSGATAPAWTSTLGVTGTRLTKIWTTDIESTNMVTVGGNSLATIFQGLDADLTTWAGITPSANVQTFLGYADFAAMKTGLGYYTSGDSPVWGSLMTMANGADFRVATTTDGHKFTIPVYDNTSAGWQDCLSFVNGTTGNFGVLLESGCSLLGLSSLDLPESTGDILTTGTLSGLTNVVTIAKTSGFTEDGGSDSNTVATDSGESLVSDAYIGMEIYNITDGSSCTVTDNDGTTWTCDGLAGGSDQLFQDGDVIGLGPGPRQSGTMFFVSGATTIYHPATVGYMAGYFANGANVIKVDVGSAAMTLNFSDDGTYTDPTAGVSVDGDGTNGDFIIFLNQSATEAQSLGVNGSWATGS
jgi:hypothetical protein